MGMHFGILAAACRWEELRAKLEAMAGRFEEVGVSPAQSEEVEWDVEVVEEGGRVWVTDLRFGVWARWPDVVVAASEGVPGAVVGYYAETVSGSFGAVVAEGGVLRRLYHACHAAISRPLSIGEAFEFEGEMESLDGGGACELLQHYGLIDEGAEGRVGRLYRFTSHVERVEGPLRRAIEEHEAAYGIPGGMRPQIKVVGRVVGQGDGAE